MNRSHWYAVAALAAGAGLLAGCSSDDPTGTVPVASVSVTPPTDTVRAGTTVQLTATPRDAGGTALSGRTITWMSSNTAAATVNASGLVTGVGNGAATITATSEGQSANAAITVWVGATGTWAGQVDAGGGGNFCALTASITEDAAGNITGTGTMAAPCSASAYTITGSNNAGGVADSVHMDWVGTFDLDFDGPFNGTDALSGEITGGGCNPGDCLFDMNRSDLVPTIREAPAMIPGARGTGPLGR